MENQMQVEKKKNLGDVPQPLPQDRSEDVQKKY